jgi:hypothetical protein
MKSFGPRRLELVMPETLLELADKSVHPPRLFERDMDRLLAEEFRVSKTFVSWFLSKINLPECFEASVLRVHVSMRNDLGESDVVVVFEKSSSREKFVIFIEDKIDAPLQPEQLNRYRSRAEAKGQFQDFRIVLCSPEAYVTTCPNSSQFDATVSYESIAEFLMSDEPGLRSSYRAKGILQAAKRANYVPSTKEFDLETTQFWQSAYLLALKEFPELQMKPVLRPAKGLPCVQFQTVAMTKKPVSVSLILKADKGVAELWFGRTDYEKFSLEVSAILEAGMTIVKSGKNSAIRLSFPSFSVSRFTEEAKFSIRTAFAVCVRLVRFYEGHKASLDSAALQSLLTPQPMTY